MISLKASTNIINFVTPRAGVPVGLPFWSYSEIALHVPVLL